VKSSLAQAPASVVRKNSASAATAAVRRPNGAASARARSKASRGSGVGSKDSGACVSVPAWAAATRSPFCADHTSAFSARIAAVCANSRQRRPSGQQRRHAPHNSRREGAPPDKPGPAASPRSWLRGQARRGCAAVRRGVGASHDHGTLLSELSRAAPAASTCRASTQHA